MALRNLTVATMVKLSGAWLDAKRARPALTGMPLLAALLPSLEQAHEGLVATQVTGKSSEQKQADAVAAEQAAVVARHDRKARGLYNVLAGLADLVEGDDEVAARLDTRDKLLPDGLRAQGRSYDDKASNAELVPARLDSAAHAVLAHVPLPGGGTLEVEAKKWLESSRALGKLVTKREALEAAAAAQPGVTQSDVIAARNAWIRAVKALRTNFDLAPSDNHAVYETLFGALDRAEKRGDRRTDTSHDGDPAGNTPGGASTGTVTTPASPPGGSGATDGGKPAASS